MVLYQSNNMVFIHYGYMVFCHFGIMAKWINGKKIYFFVLQYRNFVYLQRQINR